MWESNRRLEEGVKQGVSQFVLTTHPDDQITKGEAGGVWHTNGR